MAGHGTQGITRGFSPLVLGSWTVALICIAATLGALAFRLSPAGSSSVPSQVMAGPSVRVEPVPNGWYDWAETADRPVPPPRAAESFARSGTWTGARCLCADGFEAGYAADRTSFTVTKAPKGYEDTLGKRFLAKPRQCLNCAD